MDVDVKTDVDPRARLASGTSVAKGERRRLIPAVEISESSTTSIGSEVVPIASAKDFHGPFGSSRTTIIMPLVPAHRFNVAMLDTQEAHTNDS